MSTCNFDHRYLDILCTKLRTKTVQTASQYAHVRAKHSIVLLYLVLLRCMRRHIRGIARHNELAIFTKN